MPDMKGAIDRVQEMLDAIAADRAAALAKADFQRWTKLNADYLQAQHQLTLLRQPAAQSPASGTQTTDQQ